jgi:hypothetical protein
MNAVTLNVRSAGWSVFTPALARAVPLPTREAVGHADLPSRSSSSPSHLRRPLVLSLRCLEMKIVSSSAVCDESPLTTSSSMVSGLGFLFVPALVGETLNSAVADGWS